MNIDDKEMLYGLLNQKNYHMLFRAFICLILGKGTYSRFSKEGEDKLAIEAMDKISNLYYGKKR